MLVCCKQPWQNYQRSVFFEDSRSVISSFSGVDTFIGFNWCFGVWWFGSMGSPYKRDCYLGVPRFKSQTNGPQTTNLPVVGWFALPIANKISSWKWLNNVQIIYLYIFNIDLYICSWLFDYISFPSSDDASNSQHGQCIYIFEVLFVSFELTVLRQYHNGGPRIHKTPLYQIRLLWQKCSSGCWSRYSTPMFPNSFYLREISPLHCQRWMSHVWSTQWIVSFGTRWCGSGYGSWKIGRWESERFGNVEFIRWLRRYLWFLGFDALKNEGLPRQIGHSRTLWSESNCEV